MSTAPKVGDFAVIRGRWRYEVIGPIERVTEKQIRYVCGWTGPNRINLDDVLFSGSEQLCRALHEKCISFDAQRKDDQRKAADRCDKRIAEAVEQFRNATAATPASGDA